MLKELARIHVENGDTRGRDGTWRKILAAGAGRSRRRGGAVQSGAARGRRPQPSIDEALNSPPPVGRGTGGAVPIARGQAGQLDRRAAGGDERVGRMRTVDDVDGGRDWERPAPAPSAPRAEIEDPPTRGFATDADDSTTNSDGGGAAGAEEEIAKILNETDVYIKYNLHAKAIEHLQRAFERNPRHVGAREKLKALYLILGKKDEAVLELWSLVENAEPGRKRRYLREILEIDPRNERAAGALGERLAPVADRGDLRHRRVRLDAAVGARPRGHGLGDARRRGSSRSSRTTSSPSPSRRGTAAATCLRTMAARRRPRTTS